MKVFDVFTVGLFLSLAGCSSVPADSYRVEGKMTNPAYEGRMVYLCDALDASVVLDSTVVKNGVFSFEGKKQDAVRELLVTQNDSDMFPLTLPVVLENGRIIAEMGDLVYVANTKANDELMEFLLEKDKFFEGDAVSKGREEFLKLYSQFLTQQIMKHGNSVVGKYIFEAYKAQVLPEDLSQCEKFVK